MQVMAEALGITLPGSALIPTHIHALKEMAHQAGHRATKLAKEELKPSRKRNHGTCSHSWVQ